MKANGRGSHDRFWLAQQFVGLLAVLLVVACDTDSGSSEGDGSASTVSVALPAGISPQQLPDGKLEAFVSIDDDENNRQPLTVGADRAVGSITVTTGSHKIEVVFEFVDSANQERWELVRSAQTVEVAVGNQSVVFDPSEYRCDDDRDGDGICNHEELVCGSDPGDAGSMCSAVEVKVSSDVPTQLRSQALLRNGTLLSFVNVDGTGRTELGISDDQASGTLTIRPGDHTVEVAFEFNDNGFGQVALASQTQDVTIVSATDPGEIGFDAQGYELLDNDVDEFKDVGELLHRTSPVDPNSIPEKRIVFGSSSKGTADLSSWEEAKAVGAASTALYP